MDICLFQVNDKDDREESIDIILVSLFLTLSKYLPIEVKLKWAYLRKSAYKQFF